MPKFMVQHVTTEPGKWRTIDAADMGLAAATCAVEATKEQVRDGDLSFPFCTVVYAAASAADNLHNEDCQRPKCVHRYGLELEAPAGTP